MSNQNLNNMSLKTVKNCIKRRLHTQHYYSRVAVEFPAEEKIVYMTEPEIRALQFEVAMRAKCGNWSSVEPFISQFIIYDGRTKRGSKPMVWDKENPGQFVNTFKPGFFDINDTLKSRVYNTEEVPG